MYLIAGLGNYGNKYAKNMHNAGFLALDYAVGKGIFGNGLGESFSKNRQLKALIAKGKIGEKSVILAKPITFMNNSGEAISRLLSYYKIPLQKFFLIHDDIDISFGNCKISAGSGCGGHKGVKSVMESLGSNEFTRIRIGIQKTSYNPSLHKAQDWVLTNFKKSDIKILDKVFDEAFARLCGKLSS